MSILMIARNLSLFFILMSASINCCAQVWQQITDFPSTERDDGVSFVIDNTAYCGSGLKTGWIPCRDFYSFNLTSEAWNTINPMPLGNERQYASAFSYNGLGYVVGGFASFSLADVWQYNPQTDNWFQKSSKPGNGISGAASFVINGKAFIIGGNNETTFTNEVWMYDITADTWVQKNDFPANGIWRASGVSLNGFGYLLFGKDNNGNLNNKLFEYNTASDVWTIKSTFINKGRVYASLQAVENNLVTFGGIDTLNVYYNDLWYYNLASSGWVQQSSLPAQGRKGGMCFSDSTHLYYTTGIDNLDNRLKETWKITYSIGIKENENKTSFKIYPFFCSNFFTIKNESNIYFEIVLHNSLGEVVLQKHCSAVTEKIDVSAIRSGLYILKIKALNFSQENKIVIAR